MIGFPNLEQGLDDPGRPPTCSRASCRTAALWNVNWRNPRIHSPDRVKVWLACAEHVDYLRDYLAARDFPVRVTSLTDVVDRVETS
ncbi:MAG: hypothetical protein JWL94_1674 [Microbacteriaceae bacterium]|jgi:hypothetical protein|nr:hypothetical protein [Microbacteriaceae bacterium]HEV7955875.1 hypothetical protein [Marisediminicola sp.]